MLANVVFEDEHEPYETSALGFYPAAQSTTVIPIPLRRIIVEPHAIVVSASHVERQSAVACGNLGGRLRWSDSAGSQGHLFCGLAGAGHSGTAGIAWLYANEDMTTTVTVIIAKGLMPAVTKGAPVSAPHPLVASVPSSSQQASSAGEATSKIPWSPFRSLTTSVRVGGCGLLGAMLLLISFAWALSSLAIPVTLVLAFLGITPWHVPLQWLGITVALAALRFLVAGIMALVAPREITDALADN